MKPNEKKMKQKEGKIELNKRKIEQGLMENGTKRTDIEINRIFFHSDL